MQHAPLFSALSLRTWSHALRRCWVPSLARAKGRHRLRTKPKAVMMPHDPCRKRLRVWTAWHSSERILINTNNSGNKERPHKQSRAWKARARPSIWHENVDCESCAGRPSLVVLDPWQPSEFTRRCRSNHNANSETSGARDMQPVRPLSGQRSGRSRAGGQ